MTKAETASSGSRCLAPVLPKAIAAAKLTHQSSSWVRALTKAETA
eukprot:CAMPEP_0115487230 /NCGR_PEP_ID=MMETSP0271-20121206/60847_1 /TAXON_ID=71861 /ORGANISM="Scrippsiella trochoidea, Strain CCMP3099" /LENGTH=44 /DNA_ID= /DNA_START= /DNA_END= /DNA_ORIENTATION=